MDSKLRWLLCVAIVLIHINLFCVEGQVEKLDRRHANGAQYSGSKSARGANFPSVKKSLSQAEATTQSSVSENDEDGGRSEGVADEAETNSDEDKEGASRSSIDVQEHSEGPDGEERIVLTIRGDKEQANNSSKPGSTMKNLIKAMQVGQKSSTQAPTGPPSSKSTASPTNAHSHEKLEKLGSTEKPVSIMESHKTHDNNKSNNSTKSDNSSNSEELKMESPASGNSDSKRKPLKSTIKQPYQSSEPTLPPVTPPPKSPPPSSQSTTTQPLGSTSTTRQPAPTTTTSSPQSSTGKPAAHSSTASPSTSSPPITQETANHTSKPPPVHTQMIPPAIQRTRPPKVPTTTVPKSSSSSSTVVPGSEPPINGTDKMQLQSGPSIGRQKQRRRRRYRNGDLQSVNESDKILAVVLTKNGRFTGRKLNAKAIQKILKPKTGDQKANSTSLEAPISVSPENTFVFPPGVYFLPRPVRVAGFAMV